MSTQALRPPWELELALPQAWFHLTCDQAADAARVPVQVDAYLARLAKPEEWDIPTLRDGMTAAFLGWSSGAARQGAEAAAMRWDQDEDFGMGVATLMVRRLVRDPGPGDAELQRLRPMLARQLPSDEYAPRVHDVTLAVGPALRMEAVRQPPDIDGHPQHLRLVVEYWAPVEQIDTIQMSFGTTNLALGAVMADEFETIATNLRYTAEQG
jgi:hypothetical protein